MNNFHIIVWIVLFNLFVGCLSVCSPLYGSEPCSFLPAPPGKTPHCARPGLTYCEHPEHYPGQLIHYLIQKWRFDHKSILSDESKEEFGSYFYPPPNPVYGPPSYVPNNIHRDNTYYPEPIYIPKPQYPLPSFHGESNTYIPPKFKPAHNFSAGFNSYQDRKVFYEELPRTDGNLFNYKYSNNIPPLNKPYDNSFLPPNYYTTIGQPQISHYSNEIWNRKVHHKYERLKRSLKFRRSLQQISKMIDTASYTNSTLAHLRPKRQNTISGEPLCRSRSQYIMPRAALNNKGNWMYVVNMPEVDNRFSQLVKSEVCMSQTCNGICSLPQGYSSRCEQKFVQKRLVALEGGGNQLYTDVFWFPSCCVCTLSNT